MRMPHQEPIELAFRQRIGAVMLHRVLRRHHHERLLQRIGVTLDGHLHFVHGLEQSRLRLRRGSVDLVRQQEIREDRALLEFELLRVRVVNGHAQHVARKHVAGELQAVKTAMHGARQGLRQSGFAHARNVFNQQMTARQQTYDRQAHHFRLATNRRVERHFQFVEFGKRHRRGNHYCHCTVSHAHYSF